MTTITITPTISSTPIGNAFLVTLDDKKYMVPIQTDESKKTQYEILYTAKGDFVARLDKVQEIVLEGNCYKNVEDQAHTCVWKENNKATETELRDHIRGNYEIYTNGKNTRAFAVSTKYATIAPADIQALKKAFNDQGFDVITNEPSSKKPATRAKAQTTCSL